MLERSSIVNREKIELFDQDVTDSPPRRKIDRKRSMKGVPVTVCVAALCNGGNTILGASDEMITSGDIQFEPLLSKVWKVNNSIALMVAGDVGLHADLWAFLMEAMQSRRQGNADQQWRVRDVARMYLDAVTSMHADRAERDLLLPLGLTLSSFFSKQKEMLPEFARLLAERIQRYPMIDASAIVVGTDNTGCHIYVVEDGELTCKDAIGFAAIGAGFWHSNSHFMFAKHTKFEPGHRTALRTYAAKKRAEVAPGIGKNTDMFSISCTPVSYSPLPPSFIKSLEVLYDSYVATIDNAAIVADRQIEELTEQLFAAERAAKEAQTTATASVAQPPKPERLVSPNPKPPKKGGKR